jgi:transcriptional regulator with PAS, ATPase and Fis domain
MAKFVFFASTPKMAEHAQKYIREFNRNDVEVLYIHSSEGAKAAEYARKLEAQIIIARGTIATELKHSTDLPVVEIVITAQEMGLLIKHAKQVIKKPKPVIAIVGVAKMFCDMRDFNQIFDIDLRTHFVSTLAELEAEVKNAVSKGADLIIGGEIVCGFANSLGIPCLGQPDGTDSIEQAFHNADNVAWAADMEKRNTIELKTLLDFSSNGIIKIDKNGTIVAFNNRSLSLLDKSHEDIEKLNITQVLPSLAGHQIFTDALTKGQEGFFTFWHTTGSAFAINIVPLLVNNVLEGAILSFHEINMLKQMEADARRDLYQNNQGKYNFDWFPPLFSENASFLQTARNFAQHDECVLLAGSHPAEREVVARYMHDIGLRRNAPFVYLTGSTRGPETLIDNLPYSEEPAGILSFVDSGTLFIDEVEKSSHQAQYNLFRLLTDGILMRDVGSATSKPRIILGTQTGLAAAVQNGVLRDDLFYIVSALTLDIPSLEGCPNEIRNWLNYYLKQYSEMYSIYVHITKAAQNAILLHPWKGGIAELRNFCCKVTFNTPKHVLDESTAFRFLRQGNPYEESVTPQKNLGPNTNPQIARLKNLIEKYDGDRSMIADEMHISLTTLWRRLKKYGLI